MLYFVQIVCCSTLITVNWFCVAVLKCVFSYVTQFSSPLPKAICHQLKNVNYDYVLRVILTFAVQLLALLVICIWEQKMSTLFPIPSPTLQKHW